MADKSGDAPRKHSRVLAALGGISIVDHDVSPGPKSQAPNAPLKRKFQTISPNYESPRESSAKRIAGSSQLTMSVDHGESGGPRVPPIEDSLNDIRRLGLSPRKLINRSGFNLNYDSESPIRRIDVGGPDQQQRMTEFVSKSIDNLSQGLTVKAAMEKLKLRNIRDLLPGLEVRLMAHQIIGVNWMLDQESISQYKGGILADEMGLGKTVQMIATMAMNMPDLDDACRTTLIVVPAALLQQWKDEIETKTNGIFTVHIHHGSHKLKSLAAIKAKDVVITTYQTLNTDFVIPSDVELDDERQWLLDNGGLLARIKWYRVVLDEAQFIRNRNTRASRSVAYLRAKYRWMLTGTPITNSLADIYGLLRFGKFRPWNDWNDFNEYIAVMQREDAPLAGMRAQGILKPIMLRRTKNSKLENGQPIIELPPKNIEILTLHFSAEERDVYDSFERRSKIRLNKFIRERTLLKNHAVVLVMILRLRQLCCHPNLILSRADDFENPTALMGDDSDKELARALKVMGAPWVAQIKKKFMARALATEMFDFADEADEPEATCPICKDLFMNDSGRVLACGHEICFDCSLELRNSAIVHDGEFGHGSEQENLRAEREYEAAIAKDFRPCPTCKKMNDLSAGKTFKFSAFEPSDDELTKAARSRRIQRVRSNREKSMSDEDVEMNTPPPKKFTGSSLDLNDSSDDEMPDLSDLLAGREVKKKVKMETKKAVKQANTDLIEDDDIIDLTIDDVSVQLPAPSKFNKTRNDNASESPVPKSLSAKAKGKRRALMEDSNEEDDDEGNIGTGKMPSDAVFATWRKGDDDLEPSTKMLGLIDLLNKWDCTGDKAICYSQWTSMLDLVEKLFSRYGIRSLRYDGSMDRNSRDAALATFKRAGGPRVILISTRCGGVGLNLVSANRIINLDLSWNYAAESQAYDRVHRLGQDKDVFVKRLVVSNTIEERMLELQDVKVGLAEAALGEGGTIKLHKLSVKQVKALFGMGPKKDDARTNGK